MGLIRNELRTGVLVLASFIVLAGILIFLGAPGFFGERRVLHVYFDNANGINIGAPVMLYGRRVGHVVRLVTPVPEKDRPKPELAAMVEVSISGEAQIYNKQRVMMMQYSLLSEQVIDFTDGVEESGLVVSSAPFIGERQPGLNDVGQRALEKLDPVAASAADAMQGLRQVCDNLNRLTKEGSDAAVGLAEFRKLGENLSTFVCPDGALCQMVENVKEMTGKNSPLSRTLANTENFTNTLAQNRDIAVTLRNFRKTSETFRCLTPGIDQTVRNAERFTDTIKRQPWRLIWPSTKQYPEDLICKTTLPGCPPPHAVAAKEKRVKEKQGKKRTRKK